MSKFIKKIFGKNEDDDIPEMILQKNEPKTYYDKTLRCWMIEGQEEQIKKELAERSKLPVKGRKTAGQGSQSAGTAGGAKKKPNMGMRYASVLPQEQQDEEPQASKEEFCATESATAEAVKPKVMKIEPIQPTKEQESEENDNKPETYDINKSEGESPAYTKELKPDDKANNTLFVTIY
jgi:hypothetical protein